MNDLRVTVRRKRYGHGPPVIEGLDFTIGDGEIAALLGPSGTGKTTLLEMLAGLTRDYEGRIEHGGRPLNPGDLRTGMVFQEPRLLPWMNVRDNIELVLPDRGRAAAGEQSRWVDELLEAVQLADRADALPHELSGGMQRRVALARAFAVRPDLLLLDEPFVSLDAPTASQLRGFLERLCVTLRPTVVLVSHDLEDAITLADRLYFLSRSPARVLIEQPLPPARNEAARLQRRRTAEQLLAARPGLLSGRLDGPVAAGDVRETGS